ncbi:MAG: proteasome assembly chaperone family protein [Theionarchaea archaeon]|nr:proteasome assembly chaperone family protein [Theionarchaea archaeon]
MGNIDIQEHKKPPANAKVIIGIPDAGLVGLISSTFLIDALQMEEIASIESDLFPPVVVLHNGEPKSQMRAYAKDDIVVVISETAIKAGALRQVISDLVEWIGDIPGGISVSLSGAPVPNRVEIDQPEVFGVVVNTSDDVLENMGVKKLQEAILVGPYATILETCRKGSVPNLTLLAQSHLQYPDPGASASVLKSAMSYLGRELDLDPLFEKAEEIRVKMRDVMRSTQKAMRDQGKEQEYELPSMYV